MLLRAGFVASAPGTPEFCPRKDTLQFVPCGRLRSPRRANGSIGHLLFRALEDVLDVAEDAGIPAHAWIAAADGHIGGRGTPLADELRFVLLVCDCVRAAALRNDWQFAMRRHALQRSCFRAWRMCIRVQHEAAAEALRRRELATVAGGGGKRKRSKNRGKPGRARSAREGI